MAPIADARRERGVMLDRWWWSTVAYGWYGSDLARLGVDKQAFHGLIDSIWATQAADLIFLFTSPFEADKLNRESVHRGYTALARQYPSITIEVPTADEATTQAFLIEKLAERRIVQV
ncbi:hypothetical protein JYK22_02260, partial [Nonomuraea sp. RK-328]|nr:hypothetical protein [Nonomuraea sp. RK-328]